MTTRPVILALMILSTLSARAATEVTFRLVRADAPDQLVSTAVTKIDVDAELAKKRASDAPAPGGKAAGVPREAPVAPQAQFDHYSNYMRGIVVDGKHNFYRSYQGSYLGRTDVLKLSLDDGEHVIQPGNHRFTLAGGNLATTDATLRVSGNTVDVLCYPVTIMAVDGSAIRRMPAEVRRLPVSARLYAGADELLPKEENLSPAATFKRLTLYMLANADGPGYRVSPSDRQFHVTPDGIVVLDDAGKPAADGASLVEGKFTLVLPQRAVPVTVRGDNVQLLVAGPAGRLNLNSGPKGEAAGVFYAFPAAGGAQITAGHLAGNRPLDFPGDFAAFPRRKIVVDATSSESKEPRVMSVGVAGYSADAGKSLAVRVHLQDALDAATLAPAQVAAFLYAAPVLGDDGWLNELPAEAPPANWRPLRVSADVATPDVYAVQLPADLPASVYRLRIVADRRGQASPASPVRADFIAGVVNPAAPATLSVFCPSGRHSFATGADVPISVVARAASPIPASRLRLTLSRDGKDYPLIDRDQPELPPGGHPFHYRLAGAATAALAPGDYVLRATLGAVSSNAWSIRIARPRHKNPFPFISDSRFSANSPDLGVPYFNVPKDIAQANQARRIFRRNAELLAWQFDTATSDWYIFQPFATYMGRDSSSEVAEVETVLRGDPSLPAHEVYYYQTHWEATNEALARHGIGHLNGVIGNFSPNSLIHSVQAEVDSDLRKYQLIAQIGQKFDNFEGMALLYPNSAPLGDPEIGDQNRGVRLQTMERNFVAKHGFGPPPMSDAARAMEAFMAGKSTDETREIARRWEAWVANYNTLQGDYYKWARQAVSPIDARLRYWNVGPGWGNTGGGNYPALANAHADPVEVWTGFSDYAWHMIFEDLVRPRFNQMNRHEVRTVISSTLNAGAHNNRNHLAAVLASASGAFGYMGGPVIDPSSPTQAPLQEDFRVIRDLCRAYGPTFRQVRNRADIALLYPFRQTCYEELRLSNPAWSRNSAFWACYNAIMHLAMLGHNCEVVTEDMVDAGALDRFKVLILPVQHYLLPQHQAAVERFAATGRPVLVGAHSTLVPKGARPIDDDFAELHEADVKWGLAYPMDDAHAWMFAEMRRKAPGLRAVLDPVLSPFARPATTRVLVQTNSAGAARYTYVWNNLFPSWMATGRVTNNVTHSAYGGEANEKTVMPLKERITFPAGYHVYDLLTQRPLDLKPAADGRAEAVCDLSQSPFRIFVSLPKPIAKLRLESPDGVTLGQILPLRVTPLDADGQPIDAAVPLAVTLTDAAGATVREAPASALGTAEVDLSAPLGFTAGAWKLTVKELISGREVESTVTVAAPAALPFGPAMAEAPPVDVQRPALLAEFLAARRKDGRPVLVVVDESQSARRRALADEAAKQLAALGIKGEVRKTTDPGVYATGERVHLFQGWQEMPPAPCVDHDLLLIGGEGESVLIEEIQQAGLLVRPLTASYPGPGRGVLALVRSPFAFRRDVVCALGQDDAGIRLALAQLANVATPAPASAPAPAPTTPLMRNDLEGRLNPATPFADAAGAPVQIVSAAQHGSIAFGTAGYAKNLFVLDAATGKVAFEDKIGHVNTLDVRHLPSGQTLVSSDHSTYLRDAGGTTGWRLWNPSPGESPVAIDPKGRYVALHANGTLAVYDLALKLLWRFDEFDQYETSKEILFGRKAKLLAVLDGGDTLAYRLSGKAPGAAGEFADDVIFCDALTGKERRSVPVDLAPAALAAGAPTEPALPPVKSWQFHQNGKFSVVTFTVRTSNVDVLLDENLRPLAGEKFDVPPYAGGSREKTRRHVLPDRRLVFTVGDTVAVTDPGWTTSKSAQLSDLILSLLVDEPRGRIMVSDYSGRVTGFDLNLKQLTHCVLDSAATLALTADGKVAAGTMRGTAALLSPDAKVLWQQSLNRYAEPDGVERRWFDLEALPGPAQHRQRPWWERVAANVPLGADQAKLAGAVKPAVPPLDAEFAGRPFATYLVEWSHRRTAGQPALSLEIVESEAPADAKSAPPAPIRRLMLSARPADADGVDRAILRLGDRPDKVRVLVRAAGDTGEAATAVTVRPLAFPSDNLVRVPGLYRDAIAESVRANPPVQIDMFFNVFEQGSPHTARWADPFNLVNGKMMGHEPLLYKGKWFGSALSTRAESLKAEIPCFVELNLPRKRVVTHVVIAETPNQPRAETVTVDAYIESRETRKGLSDFEKRQLKRGFWANVVKARGNDAPHNVYKLDQPIFTSKVRVYVLGGHSSIDEIELYGALPDALNPAAAPTSQPAPPPPPAPQTDAK